MLDERKKSMKHTIFLRKILEWKIFSVEKAASHVVTHLSSVLSAREMAGFLTALLQAWLLLQKRYTKNQKVNTCIILVGYLKKGEPVFADT